MTDQEKLLDRIRKLHAKATSAHHMGSMEEAQAFAAKVNELLLKHRLEMSDLEMTEMEVNEPVDEAFIAVDPTGALRTKRKRVAWIERMASTIASAHFCKILVVRGSANIFLVGRKRDRDVAEWMIQWMVPFVWKLSEREMVKARKTEKAAGRYLGARGFRAEFVAGFVDRLQERFHAMRQEVTKEMKSLASQSSTGSAIGTALMRIDAADQAVAKYVETKYKRHASSVRMTRTGNRSGYHAGRAAADRVNLGTRPVSSGSTPKSLQ